MSETNSCEHIYGLGQDYSEEPVLLTYYQSTLNWDYLTVFDFCPFCGKDLTEDWNDIAE